MSSKQNQINESYEYNDKLNQFELLKRTKKLVQNSSRFNGYMRGCEDSVLAFVQTSKLPSISANQLSNSFMIYHKKSLSNSNSSLQLRKPGLNETRVVLGNKE